MRMILKLALKEEKKHRWIYLFITLQISITFLIGINCSTIFLHQTTMYRSFIDLINTDGRFVNSMAGVITPEADINTGISGMGILSKYLQKTDVTGCYYVLGEFMKDGYPLNCNVIVYDKPLAESYIPLLSDGEWFRDQSVRKGELRAVVSPNYYGIDVGDYLSLSPYDGTSEDINVKVTGILNQDSQIVRFQTSDNMVTYRNFLNTYDYKNELPTILLLRSDFLDLYSGNGDDLLWPTGMMFLSYKDSITDEETSANDAFIKNYMNVQIVETLPNVREKSAMCLWEQVMEVLPILAAALLFSIITTISISVLGARYAAENYRIYNMIGLSQKRCVKIQLCLNLLILGKCFLLTIAFVIIINIVLESQSKISWMKFGYVQFLICMIGGLIWLAISFLLQKVILKDPSLWRIRKSD